MIWQLFRYWGRNLSNFSLFFFGKFKSSKRHSEINWPLVGIQFLLWKGLKLFTFLPSNSVIAYGWYAVIKKAKPHYYQVSSLLTPPSIGLGYEIIHWKMTLVDRLSRYSIHESAHIMSDHENTLLKQFKLPNKHNNDA